MFRKILITVGLMAALVILLVGCSANNTPSNTPGGSSPPSSTPTSSTPASPGEIKASLGQEFTLAVGQTATISGEDLKLKFDSVTADSRCPKGVQCVWAGEAKVQLLITSNNSTSQVIYTLSAGSDAVSQDFFNQYKTIFKLDPYPEAGKQIAAGDYKLTMTVTK